MRLVVVAAGVLKPDPLRKVADEYKKRLDRWVRCDEIEVKSTTALQRRVPKDALTVALEVDGELLSSAGFARKLELWGRQGKGVVAFLVGGPDGIPPSVSSTAAARLSLSSMTLPHRLARVVLFEQLYRAMTILRGEPYSKK